MRNYCFGAILLFSCGLIGCSKTTRTSMIKISSSCPPPTYVMFPKLEVILPTDPKAIVAFDQDNWKKVIDIIDSIAVDKKLTNEWSIRSQDISK